MKIFSLSKNNHTGIASIAQPVYIRVGVCQNPGVVASQVTSIIDGKSFGAHDLYNIIDLKGNYGEHVVEIRFLESGISAFAFTFG